jgi:hypothetical protein
MTLMPRIAKWQLLLFALLLTPLFGREARAQTINARSCSSTDVQAAFNSVVNSTTTVNIPACSGGVGWATQVALNVPSGSTTLSILGAGNLKTTGGGDQTIIKDNYVSSSPMLAITTAGSSTKLRLAGITIEGGSANTAKYDGMVSIFGNSANVRVDHMHYDTTTYSPGAASSSLEWQGCTYGVVDHNIFDNPTGSVNNSVRAYNNGTCNSDALGVGDQSWTIATGLGSANFMFVEDNIFNSGAGNDCTKGGRYVWRHNTMNMTGSPPSVQTHPTGGGQRERGCRAWEIYSNTFNAVAGNYVNAAFWVSSGTGVFWGNALPSSSAGGGTGYRTVIAGHEMRSDTSTYTQSATPNGWGYCGTAFNGTGSNWDQNSIANAGYPCIDQPGAGAGQLLVNDFPNVRNNSTGTIAWPNQASEPIYEWADAYSPVPSNPSGLWTEADSGRVVSNRDIYLGTTDSGSPIAFNGTAGVGTGLLAARPATCIPKVAYWATDTQTLYQCTATNTWSTYYTPYTYPHPLTLGQSSGNVPAPPSNLTAAVN